jgi:hypothetical protein
MKICHEAPRPGHLPVHGLLMEELTKGWGDGEEWGPEEKWILGWAWEGHLPGTTARTMSFTRDPGLKKQPKSQEWCQHLEGKRIKTKTKTRLHFPRLTFFSFCCNGFIHEWATPHLCSQNNFHLMLCLWWMDWNSSLLSLKSYFSCAGEPGLRGCMHQ